MKTALQGGSLLLSGAAGALEASLELPDGEARFVALVCHPNPLQGGSFDNKVVTSLTRTCRRAGGAALRFNFRGVGASDGSHDGGVGEADDALLLIDWLRAALPGLPVWLAGFSFGAMVATRAATQLASLGRPVTQLLLVAPPVHFYTWPPLADCHCPVTLIQGEADEVVPPNEVYDWAQKQTPKPAIIRLADCGHFFHGRLHDLAQAAQHTMP